MNFSLSEIIYILLIALLVVKPEQLPDVARTLGRLVKTVRGIYTKMKAEVESIIDDKVDDKAKPALIEKEQSPT